MLNAVENQTLTASHGSEAGGSKEKPNTETVKKEKPKAIAMVEDNPETISMIPETGFLTKPSNSTWQELVATRWSLLRKSNSQIEYADAERSICVEIQRKAFPNLYEYLQTNKKSENRLYSPRRNYLLYSEPYPRYVRGNEISIKK